MRKNNLQVEEESEEINLTPMLDVVFIMLIFFIVTTSFVKESGVTVSTPSAETAAQQENANIFIAITATGEVWIDRRQVYQKVQWLNKVGVEFYSSKVKSSPVVRRSQEFEISTSLAYLF